MKAQDLRIGNLVYFNNNNIGTITEIKSSLISEPSFLIGINNRIDIYYDIDNLKFVPLTEEILLKCGFEFVRNNDEPFYQLIKNGIVFNSDYLSGEDSIDCAINIGNNLLKFKYLHQLQNIFFALTNEELTINL
jgi:hypothetical protein